MGYGVVFGGGGAKGAYEIGVWKALKELQIPIQVVVGTSVGALNGAIMTQGDYDVAVELWNNLKMSDVIRFEQNVENAKANKPTLTNVVKLIKSSLANGGMDITPLKELLCEVIDEDKIRKSEIDFGIVTFSLTDFKPVRLFKNDIPKGKLVDYLLASACFPTFKPHIIEEKRFIDGGIYDNIPISMVLEKCDSIIAIDVSGPGRIRKANTDMHELINIKNSEYLGGTLNFDGTASTSNIECGYLDTLKAFERVNGYRYYFEAETSFKNYLEDAEIESLYEFLEGSYLEASVDTERKESGNDLIKEYGSFGTKQFKRFKGYNYELIKNRIFRLLKEYTNTELNRYSLFMSMLEISAEVIGIQRKKIYKVEGLIEEILEDYKKYQINKTHNSVSSIRYFINKQNLNKEIVFQDSNNRKGIADVDSKRIAIGIAQPKLMIANFFISVLLKRQELNLNSMK